ncbi:MAG TPA: RNase adapter RapZ [Candidatus Fimadaptatus faecigallinarum]|uniref:RNase adapter RapZ n=1 Tax=Candidatus Fimadaptatus faecigallinarum TaxID=2840814 RepID=A0A9D1S546_9FIRM|nr:RNase adapter RapZ [Candidatus Fimadaptatus faecigallinarum]
MRVVILTGLSGAGKTSALHSLEDMGYFCVDNLPTQLLDPFIELCMRSRHSIQLAAIAVDVRGGQFFDTQMVRHSLTNPRWQDIAFEVLFLDASDEKLIERYKETRRDHPLARDSSLEDGIMREREALQPLRDCATHVLDTSMMTPRALRDTMGRMFSQATGRTGWLRVEVLSFGFKRGVPRDADMVLDVRFLPNPFYVASMRAHTGRDEDVRNYVMNSDDTREFMAKLMDLVGFLLPRYVAEGKNRLVIAVGCTGGQHRSVAIADALGEFIRGQGYHTTVMHRDMPTSGSSAQTGEG